MFNDHLTKFNKRCSRSPCKVNRKDKKHGNLTLPVCFHQSVFYTLLQCTQYIFNSNLIIASALTIAKTGNFSDSQQKWKRLRLFTFSSTTRKVTEQVSTDISYNLGGFGRNSGRENTWSKLIAWIFLRSVPRRI